MIIACTAIVGLLNVATLIVFLVFIIQMGKACSHMARDFPIKKIRFVSEKRVSFLTILSIIFVFLELFCFFANYGASFKVALVSLPILLPIVGGHNFALCIAGHVIRKKYTAALSAYQDRHKKH